jgi:hypothetical protein
MCEALADQPEETSFSSEQLSQVQDQAIAVSARLRAAWCPSSRWSTNGSNPDDDVDVVARSAAWAAVVETDRKGPGAGVSVASSTLLATGKALKFLQKELVHIHQKLKALEQQSDEVTLMFGGRGPLDGAAQIAKEAFLRCSCWASDALQLQADIGPGSSAWLALPDPIEAAAALEDTALAIKVCSAWLLQLKSLHAAALTRTAAAAQAKKMIAQTKGLPAEDRCQQDNILSELGSFFFGEKHPVPLALRYLGGAFPLDVLAEEATVQLVSIGGKLPPAVGKAQQQTNTRPSWEAAEQAVKDLRQKLKRRHFVPLLPAIRGVPAVLDDLYNALEDLIFGIPRLHEELICLGEASAAAAATVAPILEAAREAQHFAVEWKLLLLEDGGGRGIVDNSNASELASFLKLAVNIGKHLETKRRELCAWRKKSVEALKTFIEAAGADVRI